MQAAYARMPPAYDRSYARMQSACSLHAGCMQMQAACIRSVNPALRNTVRIG